jgi:enolase-phosphatase E1
VTVPPAAVVTDIEGTTTRIAFVHDVLFPYARTKLAEFLAARAADPDVAAVLAEVTRLHPGVKPLDTLRGWIDADAKITPLKTLQGLIWAEGYASGALRSEVYPDVLPALRAWREGGVRLYVYSSGSEAAQKQLFANLPEGDVTVLFSGFFDTNVGAKRDAGSYRTIATAIGLPASELLFLSDVGAELDAAAASGWRTCQLLRPADRAAPAAHPRASDFGAVSVVFGLPQP